MKSTIKIIEAKRSLAFIVMAALIASAAFAQQYEAERSFQVERSEDGRGVIITGYTGTSRLC